MKKTKCRKYRLVPVPLLVLGIMSVIYYVGDNLLSKILVKRKIEIREEIVKKKIDSLEYENMVKDIIIYDSLSSDSLVELDSLQKVRKIRKTFDTLRRDSKED